jgi:hypothetical protein
MSNKKLFTLLKIAIFALTVFWVVILFEAQKDRRVRAPEKEATHASASEGIGREFTPLKNPPKGVPSEPKTLLVGREHIVSSGLYTIQTPDNGLEIDIEVHTKRPHRESGPGVQLSFFAKSIKDIFLTEGQQKTICLTKSDGTYGVVRIKVAYLEKVYPFAKILLTTEEE